MKYRLIEMIVRRASRVLAIVSSTFEFIRDLPFRSCGSMLSVQGFDTAIPADFVSENRSHLIVRGGLIQPPSQSGTVLVYSAMSWAHPADLRVRDKQGMGVSQGRREYGGHLRVEALERRSRTGSSANRYAIRAPQSHPPIEKLRSRRLTAYPEVIPAKMRLCPDRRRSTRKLLADATALLAGDDDLLYLSCFTCRCGHVDTGSIRPRPDEPKPKRNARQRSPHQVGPTTVDSDIDPLV
jgi:hypothetical protein